MVKKLAIACGIIAGTLGVLAGCSMHNSPVAPRAGSGGGASLNLTVAALRSRMTALNLPVQEPVRIQYNILPDNGGAPVTGSQSFDLTNNTTGASPTLSVNLPGIGKYLVALEVFSSASSVTVSGASARVHRAGTVAANKSQRGVNETPLLLGADEISVNGLTPLNINLGNLTSYCYNGYVYDGDGNDYFNFDQGNENSNTGDLGIDYNTGFLVDGTGQGQTIISYLGNGEFVDFPRINGPFYANSGAAKGGPVSLGDVYGVKLPGQNALVWLQVTNIYSYGSVPDEIDFTFRYNNQGYNYYRFDMTTYGQAFCNDSFTPEPVPTSDTRAVLGYTPKYIAADKAGNVYSPLPVTIQGVQVLTGGSAAATIGPWISSPVAVAASKGSSATIYVADTGSGNTVWVMDANGNSLSAFPLVNTPMDIDVDGAGNVFVSDTSYYITKFSAGVAVTQFGGCCGGNGTFSYYPGIGTDSAGYLYATDYYNNAVEKFDNNGNYLSKIGGNSSFGSYPTDVAVDSSGNVYVTANYQLTKFGPTGNYLTAWTSWNTFSFTYLSSVAIDGAGRISVGDLNNTSIDTFGP